MLSLLLFVVFNIIFYCLKRKHWDKIHLHSTNLQNSVTRFKCHDGSHPALYRSIEFYVNSWSSSNTIWLASSIITWEQWVIPLFIQWEFCVIEHSSIHIMDKNHCYKLNKVCQIQIWTQRDEIIFSFKGKNADIII